MVILTMIPGHKNHIGLYPMAVAVASICKAPDMDGAYVMFPYDIKKEFGKGRVKVFATFDGESYEGSIVNMGVKNVDGTVCYIIGVLKSIRQKIGKQAGDTVKVTIKEKN